MPRTHRFCQARAGNDVVGLSSFSDFLNTFTSPSSHPSLYPSFFNHWLRGLRQDLVYFVVCFNFLFFPTCLAPVI